MNSQPIDREKLIELAGEIRNGVDMNFEVDALIIEFESHVPECDIATLCSYDWPTDTIVDVSLGMADTKRVLTEKELRQLIAAMLEGPADTEAEEMLRVMAFNHNCQHPAETDLIFFPHEIFGTHDPTVDQIVYAAVNGKV